MTTTVLRRGDGVGVTTAENVRDVTVGTETAVVCSEEERRGRRRGAQVATGSCKGEARILCSAPGRNQPVDALPVAQ